MRRKKSERVITPVTWPLVTTGMMSTRWWRKVSAIWTSEEVFADVDVVGVEVLADRLVAACRSSLDRFVEAVLDEAGVLELPNVTGKQRSHELALAEDAL